MEHAKKYPAADLGTKKNLFFSIGLLLSISLIITAFEWRFVNNGDAMNLGMVEIDIEEILEIPATEHKPPPPPVIQQPVIIPVSDDEEIKQDLAVIHDVEINQNTIIKEIIIEDEEDEIADDTFSIVEENATFTGGNKAYAKFLRKNLKYPNQARRMNIEGKVYIQFVIDKSGKISEVVALKGIGGGCDEEAVRVIKKSPNWNPGKQRGRPVKQRMVIPIIFKLG